MRIPKSFDDSVPCCDRIDPPGIDPADREWRHIKRVFRGSLFAYLIVALMFIACGVLSHSCQLEPVPAVQK